MSHSKSDSKPPQQVVSIWIIRHRTVLKMAECGRTWSQDEIRVLIAAWSDEEIQRELSDAYRNEAVYKKIANELSKAGYSRSSKQCRNKIKQLKTQYKGEVDKLRKSRVGLDSDDEDDIFSSFKWFFELHAVLRRKVIINPVNLLDTSETEDLRHVDEFTMHDTYDQPPVSESLESPVTPVAVSEMTLSIGSSSSASYVFWSCKKKALLGMRKWRGRG